MPSLHQQYALGKWFLSQSYSSGLDEEGKRGEQAAPVELGSDFQGTGDSLGDPLQRRTAWCLQGQGVVVPHPRERQKAGSLTLLGHRSWLANGLGERYSDSRSDYEKSWRSIAALRLAGRMSVQFVSIQSRQASRECGSLTISQSAGTGHPAGQREYCSS